MTEKISRRNFGKLLGAQTLLVSAASAVSLSGCGGGDDSSPTTTAAPATDTGTQALTRGAFIATISDYFDWAHSSQYIDMCKAIQPTFVDVTFGTTTYGKQIETALEESIVSNSQGYFYPEALVTREDAADMYVKAFRIAAVTTNPLTGFTDAASINSSKLASVKAIVAAGYMKGTSTTLFSPQGNLTVNEAKTILTAITSSLIAPVHSLCKPGTTAPRRYVTFFNPVAGATIYITETEDGSEPEDPTTSSKAIAYDFTALGVRQYKFTDFDTGTTGKQRKTVRVKAVAKKSGMTTSAVREFSWVIYRPSYASSSFDAKIMHAGTSTTPTIWKIWNLAESVMSNAFYIQGSTRGLLVDCLETPPDVANLKTFVDSIATTAYDLFVGHAHGDHADQAYNFTSAGVNLYCTAQCKGELSNSTSNSIYTRVRWAEVAASSYTKTITDGQQFPLGNVTCSAFATPGHTLGLATILVNETGWIYASDMWGCNRAYTADTTSYAAIKADLFLSMCQQVVANYKKKIPSGLINEVTNAHQEAPVGMVCVNNFLQAYQNLIDQGAAGTKPSIRGGTSTGFNNRMEMVGDMWRDKNWIALESGDKYTTTSALCLTAPTTAYPCSATIDYTTADGYKKYSVLSNIEISGGDLVGTNVYWAAPANGVTNVLANKFDPWTYAYTINVPSATSSIVIKPTAMSSKFTSMKLNGTAVTQGSSTTVAVSAGSKITIDITAPDGSTTSTYTFTIAKV